ncbi:Uncharacterized protein SAPIO_CDS10579 [Scedosporium apiospermum]|uniref:Mitochondrial outer membrane protein n=1 Tax=Pseudallescheria apiosperma TaxID=563466 RepID=A0A084FU26_PSEDA|nr:Uncharacterized protein SAPIO_CDS10579 [Scedosporium apiospermum]KEZ38588.1 Uncharacterized protein SAPIO_CDS10579 [Scedosporium apiospermum]
MAEPPPEPANPPTTSAPAAQQSTTSRRPYTNIFAVPEPIRRLFKRFPLRTYPENGLPVRCAIAPKEVPVLFVFADDEAARAGAPSFNPTCLKWQTLLKISGIQFHIHPSNNHASPTGALPFLLTPSQTTIPASKLSLYVATHATTPASTTPPPRAETYLSLLDSALRPAYLYALYLSKSNAPLLASLYLDSSLPRPVRASITHTLRTAAEEEILTSTRRQALDPPYIYAEAEAALVALRDVLEASETEWFFGEKETTVFDAAVFAYTNVLLDERLAWGDARLTEVVRAFEALVAHRERILGRYWPELI